ncbi:MAG: hypothetical protein FWE09_00320 [Treponema sp.]|nr:hypothetical protein [Treponema sp.]
MSGVAKIRDMRMTVREAAEALGCNPETIKGHVRELFPELMKNGLTTYLTEAQMTAVLESMKTSVSSGTLANLQSEIAGAETAQSYEGIGYGEGGASGSCGGR